MDLAHPLAVVTPTLDAHVLHALASTTNWSSGAQVHRMARTGSQDGVRRTLIRLVDQGVVLARSQPPSTLYTLNRDHVAAPHIIALSLLRAEIISRITDAVVSESPNLVHASLFGSFARGEASTGSDIDVLVVEESAEPSTTVERLSSDIPRWTGNPAHVVAATWDTIRAMVAADDPLVASWRVDHVHLAGVRLPDLLRRSS